MRRRESPDLQHLTISRVQILLPRQISATNVFLEQGMEEMYARNVHNWSSQVGACLLQHITGLNLLNSSDSGLAAPFLEKPFLIMPYASTAA